MTAVTPGALRFSEADSSVIEDDPRADSRGLPATRGAGAVPSFGERSVVDDFPFLGDRPAFKELAVLEDLPAFEELYAEHVDMVWRGLQGLGVEESSVEDAVQDVFLVVHRRLEAFEGRSSVKTWLFGIVLRVARNHRRQAKRKGRSESSEMAAEVRDGAPAPDEEAATSQALRQLTRVLSELDETKREVFVLAELEQMSAPEIAETLGINVNTVYSRLRAARRAFDSAAQKAAREVARPRGAFPDVLHGDAVSAAEALPDSVQKRNPGGGS